MTPKRALSEVGKVVGEMGRQLRAEKKMPIDAVRAFTSLLSAYGKCCSATSVEPKLKEDVSDIIRYGRPGGYEAMVERARMKERSIKRSNRREPEELEA